MTVLEKFDAILGPWKQASVLIKNSEAAKKISSLKSNLDRSTLLKQLDTPVNAPSYRRHVVSFKDSTLDVRISDGYEPGSIASNQYRVIVSLNPDVVNSLWSGLSSSEIPEQLRNGINVIVRANAEGPFAQAAITTADVSERNVPEHNYTHVDPGTLVKTQQGYPINDVINLEVKPDFHDALIEAGVTVDALLAASAEKVTELLHGAEIIEALNVVSVDPTAPIDLTTF